MELNELYNKTVINPYAFSLLLIMCIIVLFGKREYIIVPLIIIACLITNMQRIVIFGIDFPYLRILIIMGLLRSLLGNIQSSMTFNTVDRLMVYWMIIRTIAYTILWSSINAFIYRLGEGVDILGAYFLVRLVVKDLKDYDLIIKTLIIVSIPFATFMIIEQVTDGRNYFSVFGGVAEYNLIREGKLRAQGSFNHPILAGTFGALILPLTWIMWHRNKKLLAVAGLICSFIITFASSSSGPVVTLGVGIFGIIFWRFKKYTKTMRNLLFFSLIFLHLVMNKPVWHLISRIDLVGGSTGYHRYFLIDSAVRNFFNWFIFGTRYTGKWGRGLDDVTNQYIQEGVRGGILPLILFIIIIIKCFQTVGSVRLKLVDNIENQKYVWGLGVVLFAHVISFISVSYFGQIVFFYYLLIALISSLNNLSVITNEKNEIVT